MSIILQVRMVENALEESELNDWEDMKIRDLAGWVRKSQTSVSPDPIEYPRRPQ